MATESGSQLASIWFKMKSYCNYIYLFSSTCLIHLLMSCHFFSKNPAVRHITDSMVYALNEKYHTLPAKQSYISLDSIYQTFPYVSAIDKYHYFELRRNIFFDAHKNDPQQILDTSLFYTSAMIDVLEDADLQKKFGKEYVEAYQKKSALYTEAKNYVVAIELLAKCVILNKGSKNLDLVCENLVAMAYIAYQQKNYKKAISLFVEALEYVKYYPSPGMRFFRKQRTLDDIGLAYKMAGDMDSALHWHLTAEAYILDNLGSPGKMDSSRALVPLQNTYENIAQIYLSIDSLRKARYYIDTALKIAARCLPQNGEYYRLFQTKASISFAERNMAEADKFNTMAGVKYYELGSGYKLRLLYLQARIDSAYNRHKKQADFLLAFLRLKDSVNNDVIQALQKDPQAVYEQMDKQQQVAALEAKAKLQRIYIIGAVLFLLIVLLIGSLAVFNLRRVKKLNAILVEREAKLEKLLAEIEERKEAEKKQELFWQQIKMQDTYASIMKQQQRKISEDMHDEITSSLAALRYFVADLVGKAETEKGKKHLKELEDEIVVIYSNARRYMHDLNKQGLKQQHDTVRFLSELSQKFSENGLIDLRIDLPDSHELHSGLNEEQYDNLYLIIKETLSNIIKHSKAKQATVSITLDGEYCRFSIADDGIGADYATKMPGIGLSSIRNRIALLRGEVDFVGTQYGTCINGNFPLASSQEMERAEE